MKSVKKITNLMTGELFKTSEMKDFGVFYKKFSSLKKNHIFVEYFDVTLSSTKTIIVNIKSDVVIKNQNILFLRNHNSLNHKKISLKSENDIILHQKKLQNKINNLGIHYVFCSSCENKILYDRNDKKSRCVHCLSKIVPSACPDVFFNGCEENYAQKEIDIKDTIKWIRDYKNISLRHKLCEMNKDHLYVKLFSILAKKQLNIIKKIESIGILFIECDMCAEPNFHDIKRKSLYCYSCNEKSESKKCELIKEMYEGPFT